MYLKSISRKVGLVFMVLIGTWNITNAQISPPGLGKAKTAFWAAFGVRKKLDSLGTKQHMTYIGLGRKSTPEANNPFSNQAILVLNHEYYHRFTKHQQYSYALSYRRQNAYASSAPYDGEGVEQEFRAYGRYAYIIPAGRWKWTNTVRQEFRKFFTSDFGKAEENFQLRTRIKSQLVYTLSSKNKQSLALSAEGLLATSAMNEAEKQWTPYAYKETRLGIYYQFKIPRSDLSMDVGYVNNLIRGNHQAKAGIHYLAMDLVWDLPFHDKP
ncbi:DUF2490 domain-containing protein [Sphingobacterium psychroaquaticum]|uniref:DUF2490 domain-containing protein n=1 Tax=Sphingobacterium psychroaquaticum TaxID=561061 RepID=A0A1X7KEW6_9SPHI|nr:DUF2490 domain-containing protein [Sphingobacterium psychroaquaticum]SMG38985.1 hypothetical protein SAMN05660862_2730 [Sphingobacterium psychroaquaticum]